MTERMAVGDSKRGTRVVLSAELLAWSVSGGRVADVDRSG